MRMKMGRRSAWRFITLAAAGALVALSQAALAQARPVAAGAPKPSEQRSGPPTVTAEVYTRNPSHPVSIRELPPPRRFVSEHETRIRGQALRYRATAGETYITNFNGQPIASFFSFSYVKSGPLDRSRPLLFVFNGGPGSSSIWLHMGAIGPSRLVLDQEVNPASTPPFGRQPNPYSVLDVADLVFIDPVGTGFSQAVGNAVNNDFFGVDEDAESVARFIELWLTENGRWNSPKYVLGESYGSTRAAILPRALMGGPLYTGIMRGITLDGVILLGLVLGREEVSEGPDIAAGSALPSYATTAWYHNRIDRAGRTVEQLHREVTDFAKGDYATALHKSQRGELSDSEKSELAQKLAAYTGIAAEKWLKNDLRLSGGTFSREIIADRGLAAGMYDSRYTLPLAPTGNDSVADDPAMGRYVPGFITAFHDMIAEDLKVQMPAPYVAINFATAGFPWRRERIAPPVAQTYGEELAIAMRRNPRLRVMAASGFFDLVTTAASAEIQLRQAGIPEDRLTIKDYPSGHMLYLGDTAQSFAADVRAFIVAGR